MQTAGMEYLESRLMFGMVPGLESTRRLCEALGNPQEKFKTIHVVGTNGKGSTSYYLAGILQAHGFKTGLYTSPHLVSLRERIRINDESISDYDLDRLLLQVKAAAEQVSAQGESVEPTFFEVLTLVAFLYYAERQVDVAVLEAGMGGRLDSTAVAGGNIAVVTSIGLEHTEVLGPTESAILKEKMGVVGTTREQAAGKTFVLANMSSLLSEAYGYGDFLGAKLLVPETREEVQLPNLGRHYVENASLSLAAAERFIARDGRCAFDDALALSALKTRSWAGRMQTLRGLDGGVRIILDGAHNSHAVRRLVETLDEYYPGQRFHCLFGALKDKDVGEMLALMAPHVSHWHVTKTPYPRFRELDDVCAELSKAGGVVESAEELSRGYIDKILSGLHADGNSPLLITGSLYMIGACVEMLKDDFAELAFFRDLVPTTNEHR